MHFSGLTNGSRRSSLEPYSRKRVSRKISADFAIPYLERFRLLSIERSFIVAVRSAKEWENATFAERKATLFFRTMLNCISKSFQVS